MAGLHTDYVELLKRLLFDGRITDNLLIIKELMQNSDDAKATEMYFGYSSGLPSANHSLLRSPALFVVNNGPFSKENDVAIGSLSITDKTEDRSTIGKYGIGLKSVFYLSEVLFYMSASVSDDLQCAHYANVLNPYNNGVENKRPEWDHFDPLDIQAIRKQLLDHRVQNGFTIWLPLRQEQSCQLDGETTAIQQYFPGDNAGFAKELSDPILLNDIARILPMLHHLQRVHFILPDADLVLSADNTVRSCFPHIKDHNSLRMSGKILSSESMVQDVEFVGLEQMLHSERTARLKRSRLWPKRSSNTKSQIADKSEAHTAVVFQQQPAQGQGQLSIQWAVFLPVGDIETVPMISSRFNYSLLLHGLFFLSADRRSLPIPDWQAADFEDPHKEDELQQRWNAELAYKGTLALVIPALEHFTAGQENPEIEALTRALQHSDLFKKYKSHICQSYQWVCALSSQGPSWRKVSAQDEVLSFPYSSLSKDVFPYFPNLASHSLIVDKSRPVLMRGSFGIWSADHITGLLRGVSLPNVAKSRDQLLHLIDVLAHINHRTNAEHIRQYISDILLLSNEDIRERAQELQRLLELVDHRQRLALPKQLSRRIRQMLRDLNLMTLLVPGEIEVEASAQLSLDEAYQIVNAVKGEKKVHALLTKVLQSLSEENKSVLLKRIDHLKLIDIREVGEGGVSHIVSPQEARRLLARHQLYRDSSSSRAWIPPVQEAVLEAQLYITEGGLSEALDLPLQVCDHQAIYQMFQSGVTLHSNDETRKRLLQKLLELPSKDQEAEEFVLSVRYLLHGKANHLHDGITPLFVVGRQQAVLEKLAGLVLSHRGEDWRFASRALVDSLSRYQLDILRIQEIGRVEIAKILHEIAPESLDLHSFDTDERVELLRLLDDEVAKRLPLHQTVDGEYVALNDRRSYLAGGVDVPTELHSQITLIRPIPNLQQRQKDLGLYPLSNQDAIAFVLDQPNRADYALWILDHLRDVAKPSKALRTRLRETQWLTGANGGLYKPEDVIYLEELKDEVSRIADECKSGWIEPHRLRSDLHQHPHFDQLSHKGIFLDRYESIESLALMMLEHPKGKYLVGNIDVDFTRWIEIFQNAPLDVMPAARAIQALQQDGQTLFKELRKPIPEERMPDVLNFLADQHRPSHSDIFKMHLAYLKEALSLADWMRILKSIRLRSRKGSWKATNQLCFDAEGVDEDSLLDSHQELIQGYIKHHAPQTVIAPETHSESPLQQLEATRERLERYFEPWEGFVERELIGAFLSLLGGSPEVESLARRYLGKRDLDIIRDKIDDGRRPQPYKSFHDVIADYRVGVVISSGETVRVMGLTGQPFEAPKSKTKNTILIGNPEAGKRLNGHYFSEITLDNIKPQDFSPRELPDMLLRATRTVLKKLYLQNAPELDLIWEDLAKSDQFDLRYTQKIIIEDAISYVRQLKLKSIKELDDLFKAWENARMRLAEAEEEEHPDLKRRTNRISAEQEIKQIQQELKSLIENENSTTAESLLQAVRQKVEEARYQPSSVPFEIFQNADDSLVELQDMKSDGQVDDKFIVDAYANRIRFMHWGRGINQFALGGFDGEDRGYKQDLIKMLVLSASDKGVDNIEVTGKFGMGFKSVFLISSCPRVVSGRRLGFEVIGGLYPRSLDPESANSLRKRLEDEGERNGTAIELPLESNVARDDVLNEFSRWTPLLLVFARKIKQSVVDFEGKKFSTRWQESPLSEKIFVGRLHPGTDILRQALVVRTKSATLLLSLGARGFEGLDPTVPTVWVTAPTRTFARLGFAFNGKFAVDIGRSELASNAPDNDRIASEAAQELGESFVQLGQLAEDWPRFSSQINLAQETLPYEFWASFWHVIGQNLAKAPESYAQKLALKMLWQDEQGGVTALFRNHNTLPTGLTGTYRALTTLAVLKNYVKGVLSKDEKLFDVVSQWSSFQQGYPAHTIISESIYETLEKLLPTRLNLAAITIVDALRVEVEERCEIRPDQARKLAVCLTQEVFETLQDKEKRDLQDFLFTFRFLAQDGQYRVAQDLLVSAENDATDRDEIARAQFAPENCLLDKRYDVQTLGFFKLCHDRLKAPAQPLAQWAVSAQGRERRLAVLRYLLKGDLAPELASSLRNRQENHWLTNLTSNELFDEFDKNEKFRLIGLLGLAEEYEETVFQPSQADEEEPTSNYDKAVEDPNAYLERLYASWQIRGKDIVVDYESKTYPHHMRDRNGGLLQLRRDRIKWMTLLMLGVYQSLGRTQPEAHRNFLNLADKQDWLNIFADETFNAGKWFQVLDEYFERAEYSDNQSYYSWLNELLPTYQISRSLEDYVEIFIQIDKLKKPLNLEQILNPLANPIFSGSDINAPNLNRALGIGKHFVLRELVRTGVIQNSQVYAECFMPSKRVRQQLERLGCALSIDEWSSSDSRTIYKFLCEHLGEERATFDLSFDLPFRYVEELL